MKISENTFLLNLSPEEQNIIMLKGRIGKLVLAGKVVKFLEVTKKKEGYFYKTKDEFLISHLEKYETVENLMTEKDDLTKGKGKISLFVLELEEGYLYVGISKNIQEAMKIYNKGYMIFNQRHKAIKILYSREIGLDYEKALRKEHRETEKLIAQFGKEKVRGGNHIGLEEIEELKK